MTPIRWEIRDRGETRMETTWVFPATDDPTAKRSSVDLTDDMTVGDYAVRRTGEQVCVWRVGDDEPEWLGEIPVSSLPDDSLAHLDVTDLQPTDDGQLRRALEGLETSLRMRGG